MKKLYTKFKDFSIAAIFTALSCLAIYTSATDLYNSFRIMLDGEVVPAKVLDVDRVHRNNQSADYFLLIEYKGLEGKNHQLKSRHAYNILFVPETGDEVEVRFLRNNPRIALLASLWQSLFGPLIQLLFGTIFAWMAIDYFISIFTDKTTD